MRVDPVLVRRIAGDAGFRPTTLEKVARLEDILREISQHPEFGPHLALKGGTAINFVLLPEAPRLSVDIDLDYIGAIEREAMLEARARVEEFIARVAGAQRYAIEKRAPYGLTGWELTYENIAGNPDIIKVEINWLLRVPIWQPERVIFRSVLPGDPSVVTVTSREEVVAGKLAALLGRAAPRDLFDVATLAEHGAMGDRDRLRAASVLLGTFRPDDFRERLARPHVGEISEREIRNVLWPTLRKDLRPTLGELRNACEPALREILALGEKESRYLDEYCDRDLFDPTPLFEGLDANPNLPRHPMAAWRLQQRKRPPVTRGDQSGPVGLGDG